MDRGNARERVSCLVVGAFDALDIPICRQVEVHVRRTWTSSGWKRKADAGGVWVGTLHSFVVLNVYKTLSLYFPSNPSLTHGTETSMYDKRRYRQ